jgi:hypothetical protein
MKIGDLVKITKPKAYQQSLSGETGVIVEHFHPRSPGGKSICRVFWPGGKVDKAWRLCNELEIISESW